MVHSSIQVLEVLSAESTTKRDFKVADGARRLSMIAFLAASSFIVMSFKISFTVELHVAA